MESGEGEKGPFLAVNIPPTPVYRILSFNLRHREYNLRLQKLKKTLIPFLKKKYINFGATLILRPLSCTEFNSIQGDGCGLGVSHSFL